MLCTYINPESQKKCRANATKDGFCFIHSSNYEEARAEAIRKGGRNRRNYKKYGTELEIKSIDDIKHLLVKAINATWTGQMATSQPANSIGFLARIWLDAHEKSELSARLKRIEEKLELTS